MIKRLTPVFILLMLTVLTAKSQTNALFATATHGGSINYGTILQGNMDGSNFHVVYNFDYDNGYYPVGRLAQTTDGKIYCCTQQGGFTDSCVICCYDPGTGTCHKVYDYYYTPEKGWEPSGGLVLHNGLLYGMTSAGGAGFLGSIYSFNPVDSVFTDLYDFDGVTGGYPKGELLMAPDGKFYATGNEGGPNNNGVLFSFDPNGNVYTPLYYFNDSTQGAPQSANLICINNQLYGVTAPVVGITDSTIQGIIYSFNINTHQFNTLHTFAGNYSEGIGYGGLMQASDGKLYGISWPDASLIHLGGIYSYDLGTGNFNMLKLFTDSTGYSSQRTLSQFGTNKLFGSLQSGGAGNGGVLFSFDIGTHTFTSLLSFDGSLGAGPDCDIVEANVANTTGIRSVPQAELNLYPNPTSEQATITLPQTSAGSLLNIYDVRGNKVAAQQLGNETQINLNVSQWAKGTYLVEITTNSKIYRNKLVVN